MKRWVLLGVLGWFGTATAAVKIEIIEYRDGDAVLEGYLAFDDSIKGPRPGVVVIHQWKGLGEYEKKRAAMLAELGYVAFCADAYGRGIRPQTVEDAGKLSSQYKADRPLLRRRVQAALATLKSRPECNPKKTGVMGYCFGGTAALELARSGADTLGVVSFHGGLNTPTPDDAKSIKAHILALHGADDPYVPPAEVQAFEQEMRAAGLDWQLVSYGGAVHSFTDWNATGTLPGAKYHLKADKRSWEAMKEFFRELFQ